MARALTSYTLGDDGIVERNKGELDEKGANTIFFVTLSLCLFSYPISNLRLEIFDTYEMTRR